MLKRVGFITIGQAPRNDIIKELYPLLGQKIEIVEKGALDELSMDEIKSLKPEKDDLPLITRLRDSSSVVVGKRRIIPLIQRRLEEIENSKIKICALLCTEEFDEIKSKIIFIMPSKLIFNITVSLLSQGNLFVFIPMKEQIEHVKKKWEKTGLNFSIEVLNPYSPFQDIEKAVERIRSSAGDLMVFDCIGYTFDLKKRIQEITGKPAILPRSVLGMTIKEIL